MSAATSSAPRALSQAELQAEQARDDGDFVGILYDTILYERACNRLETQKKYDFPLKYDEIAYDFLAAYRLCLEPKFLANRHTAVFSHFILQSKLLNAKGVRTWALDHWGRYEIFPLDDESQLMDGAGIDELNENDFSDYDEVEQGLSPVRKNVGYEGPMLTRRRQGHYGGPVADGQAHREMFSLGYSAVYKHSQDMIAVIIAHLRKRVWYHDGSGGDVVEIQNMGVDGKDFRRGNRNVNGDLDARVDQAIKDVKGVKKYTRQFNGKIKRRNHERALARTVNGAPGFWQGVVQNRDPPTDYSDSEAEDAGGSEAQGVDTAIDKMAAMYLTEYTGSPRRIIRFLPASRSSETLYDWRGANDELRLVDLAPEEEDTIFYGRLTRDIMAKYKQLLPPTGLIERHKELRESLQNIISGAFPAEDFEVEAYGSFVSGLLMANSDADFCITGPNIHSHEQLNNMSNIANILSTRGQMKNVVAIPDAMVPIVKFQDPKTNMECDLNTGNNLGVVNSELIRVYTTIDERVKPFLYILKAICKAQGINDSRSGYLSSYAITWMGIVFLQQSSLSTPSGTAWGWGSSPLLPKLQQQPFERMKELTLRINHNTKNITTSTPSLVNSSKNDMVHCRFDDNSDGKHTGSGRANKKSLGRLLIEFFEFFSRRFNYTETTIHVGRGGMLPKTSKERHNESLRLPTFRVVDPFLHHRNITGTCRGETLGRVWRAFDHSYRMLCAGDLEGAMRQVD
ncbi:hypothetical protein BGZ54_002564 [Gamsiella multidivaricata]|nr:hypothetical protein BGZ54_002564 [Gamsiella multidivaricata]